MLQTASHVVMADGKHGSLESGKSSVHKQQSAQKSLSLNELIAKWRALDDASTIVRMIKLMQQQARTLDGDPKPALSTSTLHEYTSSLRLLQTHLTEDCSGQPRSTLPSYMEYVLRPNGPQAAAQLLGSSADIRRVAIAMASAVSRCFPNLEPSDKERALKAWRCVLSQARKDYLQARDKHGGYGGFVDESLLLTTAAIHAGIQQLPLGSADRCILKLLQAIVPIFPPEYRVNSPLLNLGDIKITTNSAAAPSLDVWSDAVQGDSRQESGLLLVTEDSLMLFLLLDIKACAEVVRLSIKSPALTAEVRAYLASLPPDMPVLFPHVKGITRTSSKAYSGPSGRDSFNGRINRILASVWQAWRVDRDADYLQAVLGA